MKLLSFTSALVNKILSHLVFMVIVIGFTMMDNLLNIFLSRGDWFSGKIQINKKKIDFSKTKRGKQWNKKELN